MPASPTATPEHIKDVNTRYHDAAADEYDAKWGIDFGDTGQEQVRLKLAKALGGGSTSAASATALEIGSGTGYFSLNLLQLGVVERLTATDISPGMLQRLSADRRGARARGARPSPPRPRSCPSRTRASTSSSATPSSTTSPTSSGPSPNSAASCGPGGAIAFAGEPSRYGDRLAAAPEAGRHARRARLAPRRRRRAARLVAEAEQSHGHALEGEVDVHAFAPADLRRMLRDAGFERPPRRRRGAARQRLGLGPAHGRVERRARIGLLALAQLRLPQLHRPAEGRHPRCSSPASPPSSSTTCSSPAASRPSPAARACGGRGRASTPESMPLSRRSPAKE